MGISSLQVTEIVSSITLVVYRTQHLKIIRCLLESQGKVGRLSPLEKFIVLYIKIPLKIVN